MKLTASLIVKNEVSEIEGCLDSLLGVDEIVVVDTGSTDGTKALVDAWAERNPTGPKVVQGDFEWIDDFSAARNYAAGIAKREGADWILTISADGRMAPGSIEKLRKHIEIAPKNISTFEIVQRSIVGNCIHKRVMVHRPGVRWSGVIHENLQHVGVAKAYDVIMDYGWSESHHNDIDRNLRILTKEANDNPTARTFYYLGSELMDRKRYKEAEIWFRRCIEKTQWKAEKADAYLFLAKIMWRTNEGDKAREFCMKSLLLIPDCKETLDLLAEMSWPEEREIWKKYAQSAGNKGVIFARNPVS